MTFLFRKEPAYRSIFVGIGANLPAPNGEPPCAICERAARDVAALPGMGDAVRSPWYSSAPIPLSGQPRYINGVLRLTGMLTPEALLKALQAIEAAEGRVRSVANAARTLDLDIIAMDRLVQAAPDPVLPHPRMHLRRFVLLPLRDVAPDWHHPARGVSVAGLLAALPPQDIRLMTGADRLARRGLAA